MSFSKIKFFGCTVRSLTSSLGWNLQASQCTIQLVEDPADRDFFIAPSTGTPTYFFLENFEFFGLLQRWQRRRDISGNPVFDVTLVDPREILENCTLLTDSYAGPTFGVPNLLNVYGYWESTGFGQSFVNEGGMKWNRIKLAVHNMTNLIDGSSYGGPLLHKTGVKYAVDLSELPTPPDHYRLSGPISLLEAIARVCDDGACDFFIQLIPGIIPIIKIRTASRRLPLPLGTISSLINTNTDSGLCVSSANGVEASNNASSSFLVGALKTEMYETSSVQPFWGTDALGQPITGVGDGFNHTFTLNAIEVSDILGGTTYECNTLELCCALVDINMWAAYIDATKPALATALGLLSACKIDLEGNQIRKVKDTRNTGAGHAIASGGALTAIIDHQMSRLYSFVQKYASEFLGKKFLVPIPFVVSYTESETGRIVYNNEPTDSGYASELAPPLGLNPIYQTQFTTQDGKFIPYCTLPLEANMDFSRLYGGDFVIDNGTIYMPCNVDPHIVFVSGEPAVVITLQNSIYRAPLDYSGAGYVYLDAIFKDSNNLPLGQAKIIQLFKDAATDALSWFISPLPHQPTAVTVPMKSNVATYGPWYAVGAPGRVQFQADSSLAPWNYGGFQFMNLAAQAKVIESATFQQFVETGFIELVGAPAFSLGDIMQVGGPAITNIEIGYGTQGISTRYTFSTYTPRFGTFSKQNSERIKRVAGAAQEIRREVRSNANKILQPLQSSLSSRIGETFQYMRSGFFPKEARGNSPHSMIFGRNLQTTDSLIRSDASVIESAEFIRNLNADDIGLYSGNAGMSISGLLRPFMAGTGEARRTIVMPKYTPRHGNFNKGINVDKYNPFQSGNDIEWYLHGEEYNDCKTYHNDGPESGRLLALRGPLVVSGWGYDINGNPAPSGQSGFQTNHLRRCTEWPTGPVDLLWDHNRGVWTSHDLKFGRTKESIAAEAMGIVSVHDDINDATGKNMNVYNFFSQAIPSGTRVTYGYMADANKWFVISADCSTSAEPPNPGSGTQPNTPPTPIPEPEIPIPGEE